MSRPLRSILTSFALAALLGACGRSTTVRTPLPAGIGDVSYAVGEVRGDADGIPAAFTQAVSSALWARLNNAGRRARAGDADAYRVDVTITTFRRRSIATRILFGAMAGADLAEATATVVSPDGRVVGEWAVSAYNASAVTDEDYVADALADEITRALLKPGR